MRKTGDWGQSHQQADAQKGTDVPCLRETKGQEEQGIGTERAPAEMNRPMAGFLPRNSKAANRIPCSPPFISLIFR